LVRSILPIRKAARFPRSASCEDTYVTAP
jgi:hypothetical protein